jgi:spore coat protein A
MGIAGAASALPLKWNLIRGLKGLGWNKAWAWENSMPLAKFGPLQTLQGLGPTGIPTATATTWTSPWGETVYSLEAAEFNQVLHPALPNGTRLWGYGDAGGTHRALGGFVMVNTSKTSPQAVRLRMKNSLPNYPIIPMDPTLPDTDLPLQPNRMAIHLHGGFIPWVSDGGPFDWYLPDGTGGASFQNGPGSLFDNIVGHTMLPGEADYYYPNQQSMRLMWYHDHAHTITRTNAYAGLATGFLLRDDVEAGMIQAGILPGDNRLIPLIIQDKIFVTQAAIDNGYGTYVGDGTHPVKVGDLWYPYQYDPAIWGVNDPPAFPYPPPLALPVPSCIPEMYGDTMLVNGTVYPTVSVQQRKYRFLVLNACNARVLTLRIVKADATGLEPTSYTNPVVGPPLVQIGTEGGFLPAPVTLTGTSPATTLLMAPAERADLIVDFSRVAPGKYLLYNDAPAPFPTPDPRNDYYPGSPGAAAPTNPGEGPNTRTLMQIVVTPRVGAPDPSRPLSLPRMDPAPLLPAQNVAVTRQLTLNEDFDTYGRLIQTIGTNVLQNYFPGGSYGLPYVSPVTENPNAGDTEIWEIANRTGDTHPLHFHLVNCQIISRQPFDSANYNGTPTYTGPSRGPEPNEKGWKETIRMNPDEVIRIIMKFDLPTLPFTPPVSNRTGGYEYVYHCHILEHEEHDMMRPLVVNPPV